MCARPQVFGAGEAFALGAAAEIAALVRAALAERGVAFVALAGGGTPRQVYRALAGPRGLDPAEWRRVRIFWSDERVVPPGDSHSNAVATTANLARGLVPPQNVHVPRLGVRPEVSALHYEREIRRVVVGSASPEARGSTAPDTPCFDLILLGVGLDGHTASLFPDQVDKVEAADRLVVATRSPLPPRDRISFTFALIAAARTILFLVAGGDKAEIVRRVIDEEDRSLPAALIESRVGTVRWILDSAAGSRLSRV